MTSHICPDCGVVVEDQILHNRFHRELESQIRTLCDGFSTSLVRLAREFDKVRTQVIAEHRIDMEETAPAAGSRPDLV